MIARPLLVLLLASSFALAGCGGSDAETTGDPGEIEFELDDENEGTTGVRATLTYEDADRTTIVIDGLDEGESAGGGPNPAWLRRGACDELEDVVAELEPLEGTESTTTVDVGLPELIEGEYAIAVALPGSGPDDDVVACGAVPDEAPE